MLAWISDTLQGWVGWFFSAKSVSAFVFIMLWEQLHEGAQFFAVKKFGRGTWSNWFWSTLAGGVVLLLGGQLAALLMRELPRLPAIVDQLRSGGGQW